MSGSLNKVMLIGNVFKDPEIRPLGNGKSVANLGVVTNETWKDANTGEKKEKAEWHRVVSFNPGLVNVIEKYITKGAKVYIEGKIETKKWQDQQGNDRYSTEVIAYSMTMLGGGRGSSNSGSNDSGGYGQDNDEYDNSDKKEDSDSGFLFDDDIPF